MYVRRVRGPAQVCVFPRRAPAVQCAADTRQSRDKYLREKVRPFAS